MSTRASATCRQLVVRRVRGGASQGLMQFGPFYVPCALGRRGVRVLKREGDGSTPSGDFEVLYGFYNPSRSRRPDTAISIKPIARRDGWCDAPCDRNYNRPVKLPYGASAEAMWRDDGLYDLVVVLGYNIVPRMRFRGSAIFMHVARPGFSPTEGCIALRARDLLRVLALMRRGARVATAAKKARTGKPPG